MKEAITADGKQASGRGRLWEELPSGLVLPRPWSPNTILYGWASIVLELLRKAPDGKQYGLGALFIEFENNSGAEVSPPTVTRGSQGVAYYDALADDANRDYVRAPITSYVLTSSDEDLFPDGNVLMISAKASASEGVHGKPFSDSVSSRVFGLAVASTPKYSDPTLDRVFSRLYFDDPDEQVIRAAGKPVGADWELTLN